jgi:hypothetical protein
MMMYVLARHTRLVGGSRNGYDEDGVVIFRPKPRPTVPTTIVSYALFFPFRTVTPNEVASYLCSTVMTISFVLKRNIKTTGGLRHGRLPRKKGVSVIQS